MQNNDAKLAVVERRIDIIVGKLYCETLLSAML
jgi:hypothetical protein